MSKEPAEWFDQPEPDTGQAGLRFECTMCGNCCSGPPGYVKVSDAECQALAARLGLRLHEFLDRYTEFTPAGRSLTERLTKHGFDCVFLDREKIPGKAVCGVYEDRPEQCRTWPFWTPNLQHPRNWLAAARTCPGINKGKLIPPEQIRILRAKVDI